MIFFHNLENSSTPQRDPSLKYRPRVRDRSYSASAELHQLHLPPIPGALGGGSRHGKSCALSYLSLEVAGFQYDCFDVASMIYRRWWGRRIGCCSLKLGTGVDDDYDSTSTTTTTTTTTNSHLLRVYTITKSPGKRPRAPWKTKGDNYKIYNHSCVCSLGKYPYSAVQPVLILTCEQEL